MRATGLTHVAIHATDLEKSVNFYISLFGMERVPTPDLPHRVEWLRFGDLMLHVVERNTTAPDLHHFGLSVDDFEGIYLRVKELAAEDTSLPFYELPSGSVMFYIRDPAGNIVEINWPDASTLDRSIVSDLVRLDDDRPQGNEAREATLFLSPRHVAGSLGT